VLREARTRCEARATLPSADVVSCQVRRIMRCNAPAAGDRGAMRNPSPRRDSASRSVGYHRMNCLSMVARSAARRWLLSPQKL
jgi:hypothetical protein